MIFLGKIILLFLFRLAHPSLFGQEGAVFENVFGLGDDVAVPDHAGMVDVELKVDGAVGGGGRGGRELSMILTGNQRGENRVDRTVARNDSQFKHRNVLPEREAVILRCPADSRPDCLFVYKSVGFFHAVAAMVLRVKRSSFPEPRSGISGMRIKLAARGIHRLGRPWLRSWVRSAAGSPAFSV